MKHTLKHTTTTTMKRRLRRRVKIDGPLGQTSSAYATLTDLPNELVEKIVDDLDDDGSICRLSLTCKRLHFLVLPMFFSRSELENLQNGFFHCHDPVPELLEAIRTALFVHSLSTFTFYFTTKIDQVISDISSLRGLLARIPPVGTIVLGLPENIGYAPGIRKMERWGRAFLKLLETIDSSGCRDLRLLDPIGYPRNNFFNDLYVAAHPPAKPKGTKSRGMRNSGGFRPHRSTGMSTIQILSPRLFQPFFIRWIIDMLKVNRESLVCIHLNIPSIHPVLKSMNFPAIKEVDISSQFNLVWVGLCRFLNRHPSITSLRLDGIIPFKDQIFDSPIILPYLTQLTAMSPIVNLLLQHRNRVPLLSFVHVLLRGNVQCQLDPLAAIATHAHISSLQLSSVPVDNICLTLERHVREDKSTRIITSLGHIRSVVVDQPVHPGRSSPSAVKRWFYLFPHLEHVSLSFRLLCARVRVSDEERHGVVTEFATQLAADRPTVKTLSVGSLPAVNLDDLRRMPGFKA